MFEKCVRETCGFLIHWPISCFPILIINLASINSILEIKLVYLYLEIKSLSCFNLTSHEVSYAKQGALAFKKLEPSLCTEFLLCCFTSKGCWLTLGSTFDLEGMKSKASFSQPLPDTCLTVAITSPTILQFPFMCHFLGSHLWYEYKTTR